MIRQRSIAVAGSVLTALGLAACAAEATSAQPPESVRDLVAHGHYVEAYQVADRARSAHPGDAAAESDLRLATVAALLEKGRRACFADRDDEALKEFDAALAIAPDDRIVQGWHAKMLHKLAERALLQAVEFHAQDNLAAAAEKYDEALKLEPTNLRALEGQARTLLQTNYRAGMGERYYRDGAQALSNYFLSEARSYFTYSMKYQPNHDRAGDRKAEVSSLLAEERSQIAEDLESRGLYAAARNEFRIARLVDPSLDLAREGVERTSREAAAADAIAQADRLTLKKQFDEARRVLERGRVQSQVQSEQFDAATAAVDEAELGTIYDEARTYEGDFRYPDALERYNRLLAKAQFYKDAITRRDNVQAFMQRADETYALASKAATPADELSLLRSISVYWPDYKDIRTRIKTLEGTTKP